MTKVTCPVCKSSVDRGAVLGEFQPVEFDEHGLPWACAVQEGFGLPIWATPGGLTVLLNGQPVNLPVAFDRRAGLVWCIYEGPNQAARRRWAKASGDFSVVFDRLEGEVTVRWKREGADQ